MEDDRRELCVINHNRHLCNCSNETTCTNKYFCNVYLKEKSSCMQMKYKSVAKDRRTIMEIWESSCLVKVAK